MKNLAVLLGAALAAIPHASAHYFFPHFIANGNFTEYFEYVREDTQGYMPFKGGYSSDEFRCNTGSQGFASKTGVYNVKAGDTIGFGTDFNALIQHPGPLQVYMSKAPGDVREYDGSGDWFKIYELGPEKFSSDGIEWGTTDVGNFTFELPKEIPSGQYLVRIEHIALHGAGDWGQAEFYFNCAQIEVESDSSAIPGPTVKIPGVYDGYEPGIMFYMYRPWIVNYTMPGPRPYPDAAAPNVTASGVSVAPTATPWTLPAVTNFPSSVPVAQSSAVRSSVMNSGSVVTSTPLAHKASSSFTSSRSTESLKSVATASSTPSLGLEPVQAKYSDASASTVIPTTSSDSDETCGIPKTVTVHETVTISSTSEESTCVAPTLTTTITTTTTVAATFTGAT
ncbi:unnamed protein product [Penicillium salamii]|uniref:AA9 family lytic polysaccharide monooxygenase n=1 Tax=Penicillium salamii TaxID=1612424 RepID=A0A9W4NIG8_9EURO|nr:unnamed protein product [Penicillium salamii]